MIFQDKIFYKIGEVAHIAKLEPYILRYWETEFPLLSPEKSKSGRRLYKKKDIEIVLKIKKLLYEDRFSIEGAKRKMEEGSNRGMKDKRFEETIAYLHRELQSILFILREM